MSDAQVAARTIGFPVAIKILSPDISHKSDVGGVELNLADAAAVQAADSATVAAAALRIGEPFKKRVVIV